MSSPSYKQIIIDGLWKNNPALVQLLGLCPLLAVSATVVNALGLGLATVAVLVLSNLTVSLIRHQTIDSIRLPAFVMIIATFTTCISLLMQAFTYELYQILGIFIPLIVTNCAILGRADAFASKNNLAKSAVDGLAQGTGFLVVLVLIGAVREVLGRGTLFSNMDLLFGDSAQYWEISLFGQDFLGMLVIALPPGAFIVTGFIIAGKNTIDSFLSNRKSKTNTDIGESRRVRTTGKIT